MRTGALNVNLLLNFRFHIICHSLIQYSFLALLCMFITVYYALTVLSFLCFTLYRPYNIFYLRTIKIMIPVIFPRPGNHYKYNHSLIGIAYQVAATV